MVSAEIQSYKEPPWRISHKEVFFHHRGTEDTARVAATKSEARNPKSETNSNDQNSNDPNKFGKQDKKFA